MAEPRGKPIFVWGMVVAMWIAVRIASPVIFPDTISPKLSRVTVTSAAPNFRPGTLDQTLITSAALPVRIAVHRWQWAVFPDTIGKSNAPLKRRDTRSTAAVPIAAMIHEHRVVTESVIKESVIKEEPADHSIRVTPTILQKLNQQQANKKWQIYAYSFWRASSGGVSPQPAAAAAQYGGSQTGIQAVYRIAGKAQSDLSLLARFSAAPSGNGGNGARWGSEWAGGLTWKPSRKLPLRISSEYRQRSASDSGSDFGSDFGSNSGNNSGNNAAKNSAAAVYVAGGADDVPLWQGLRIGGFGQAGWVQNLGAAAPPGSLFLDAGARIEQNLLRAKQRQRGLASVSLGGGVWAGGQRGSQRLDIGPAATFKANIAGQTLQLRADWRFRIGGNAEPGDGPAVTLSTGF